MNRPEISIVIPAYNEADTLRECLADIHDYARSLKTIYEIIIIDDGSEDKTWEIINRLSETCSELKGIRFSRNFGKEAAIAAGLECAIGDAVIVMDADMQHPPKLIPELVRVWKENGVDIVEAVKRDRGKESLLSKLRAGLFYWLMKKLTGLDLENASDFKLLSRKVIEAHNRLPESSRFFRGIVFWLGFRKSQIPFSVGNRMAGISKWSSKELISLAVDASTSFSSIPLHFVTIMGIATFLLSVVIGAQTLYRKFLGTAVSGFTTVIILLLFIGSTLMCSLGIIGIYLSRIFEEVKRRPKSIIDETVNLRERNRFRV